MPSADQVPVKNPHSIMRWHEWVVLTAGSTGSALRAVRPPNLHITPDVGAISFTPPARRVACSARPWRSRPQHQERTLRHSFNHSVCPNEHRLRDRQAKRLGGIEVDHQPESGRLFYRQVPRFGTLENLVHICCRKAESVYQV